MDIRNLTFSHEETDKLLTEELRQAFPAQFYHLLFYSKTTRGKEIADRMIVAREVVKEWISTEIVPDKVAWIKDVCEDR